MATNNNNKALNVPHLRFPEFKGEWERCKFGDIATGFDYGMNAAAKPFDGENKYIRITDIDDVSSLYRYDDIVSPDGEIADNYLVRENDILLARTGASTGKSYLYRNSDGKLYFAGFLIRANIRKHNSYFVFTQLHTHRYWRWVSVMSARSGQPGINSQEYASFPVYTTSLQEENKIAAFFKLLDDRIATQNKIIERLETLIKAIGKTLLGESDKYMYLGDLCDIKKGTQINKSALSNKGPYYVMNGGIVPSGYYDLYNTNANTISISEGGNSCGYVQYNYTPFWSGGHCYTLENISPEVDCRYLFHYLKANELEIMSLRIGSGLPNIQKKDLSLFRIPLPTWKNQKTVARSLDLLLYKIVVEQNTLQGHKLQKAYLLQQMFI